MISSSVSSIEHQCGCGCVCGCGWGCGCGYGWGWGCDWNGDGDGDAARMCAAWESRGFCGESTANGSDSGRRPACCGGPCRATLARSDTPADSLHRENPRQGCRRNITSAEADSHHRAHAHPCPCRNTMSGQPAAVGGDPAGTKMRCAMVLSVPRTATCPVRRAWAL